MTANKSSVPEHQSPFDEEDTFPSLTGIRDGIMTQRMQTLSNDGEYLTVMCVGESGVGKSTLLQNIFSKKFDVGDYEQAVVKPTVGITSTVLTLNVDQVPFYVQCIDTAGYGDTLDVAKGFQQIVSYIDKLYEKAMNEEMRAARDGVNYEHLGVDVILYFIAPHRLKGLDLEMLRMLQGKAAIIPILSKADTMTLNEIRVFKKSVIERLDEEGIDTFHPPLAIISSPYVVTGKDGSRVIGREYLWGTAECDRDSDLPQLRRLLIAEGLHDLQRSKRGHYEQFRARKLRQMRGNFLSRIVRFTVSTVVQACVVGGAMYALHKGAENSGLYDRMKELRGGGTGKVVEAPPPPRRRGWGQRRLSRDKEERTERTERRRR